MLTCTVLLDPQPEGRHTTGMRAREGDSAPPRQDRGPLLRSGEHDVGELGRQRKAGQAGVHLLEEATGSGESLSRLGR